MENEVKKSRGGARPGAGRKKVDRRDKAIATRVSFEAYDKLATFAESRGISMTAALNLILEGLD